MKDSIYSTVLKFAILMLRELRANDDKGDWEAWKPDAVELIAEIEHHKNRLHLALCQGDVALVAEHSADLANICMKAHEVFT